MTAAQLRDIGHEPGTDRWWEAWTWRLGRMLAEVSHPLLYAGRWCLRPVQAIDARKASRYPVSPMEWGFGENPAPPHSLEGCLASRRSGPRAGATRRCTWARSSRCEPLLPKTMAG